MAKDPEEKFLMKSCPACGRNNHREATECANCGADLADVEKSEAPFLHTHYVCPNCEKYIPTPGGIGPNYEPFCTNCGWDLVNKEMTKRCARCEGRVPASAGTCPHCGVDFLKLCPSCGQIPEATDTCTHCGFKLFKSCPSCGHKNAHDEKQCAHCGFNFFKPCPSCSHKNAYSKKQCAQCGIDFGQAYRFLNELSAADKIIELYRDQLIEKDQLEAKLVGLITSIVDEHITIVTAKFYLQTLKKYVNDGHIDNSLYKKLSDQILNRCDLTASADPQAGPKNTPAEKPARGAPSHLPASSAKPAGGLNPPPKQQPPAPPPAKQIKTERGTNRGNPEQGTKKIGTKITLSVFILFAGGVLMGLIEEFQGHGILHGIAGIGTVWGLFHVWGKL